MENELESPKRAPPGTWSAPSPAPAGTRSAAASVLLLPRSGRRGAESPHFYFLSLSLSLRRGSSGGAGLLRWQPRRRVPRSGPRAGFGLADQAAEPCSSGRVLAGRTAAAWCPRVKRPDKKEKGDQHASPGSRRSADGIGAAPPFWWKGWGAWKGGVSERVVTYDLTVDGV